MKHQNYIMLFYGNSIILANNTIKVHSAIFPKVNSVLKERLYILTF